MIMLGFTILNVKASANDSKTVISGGRDDQGGLSDAKFGTLRRFSKESAELPSLSNLMAVTKLPKIILEHVLRN